MWKDLSMKDKAAMMRIAVKNGIYDIGEILNRYNKFEEGGSEDTSGMTGMMKARLALASLFNNPTARRMTNYDTRSAMTPEGLGNVYMGSFGNYAIPSILDVNGELKYIPIEELFNSKENSSRSADQSIKFDREKDARYFAEHYKEIAPMMGLWRETEGKKVNGGKLYNKFENGGSTEKYPEVTIKEESWADEYFKNNPTVAGMAIGAGMNGVDGPRRVIINPYNLNMQDSTQRISVLLNERYRHQMDETNFRLPNVSLLLMNNYKGTAYENDTINIGRTEAARYMTGDPSHSLTKEQIDYLNSIYNKKALGGPLFNSSSPIESFQGRQTALPIVRYDYGGKINKFGGNTHSTGQMNISGSNNPDRWLHTTPELYIIRTENADSIGFDPKTRLWTLPTDSSKYDIHQIGIGNDVRPENNSRVLKYFIEGAEVPTLTEQGERAARYEMMDYGERLFNNRLNYAKKRFGYTEDTHRAANIGPNEVKKAITMSAIYNKGADFVARNHFENDNLMRALLYGTDEEYFNLVMAYYGKDKARIGRERKAFEEAKRQNYLGIDLSSSSLLNSQLSNFIIPHVGISNYNRTHGNVNVGLPPLDFSKIQTSLNELQQIEKKQKLNNFILTMGWLSKALNHEE